MPGGLHTTGRAGRPDVPLTSKQSGLIIVMGGSVFNTETSPNWTQTAERINSDCDDLGYSSKDFDSNFLSFLQFFPFLASYLQRLFHSFWNPLIYNVPLTFCSSYALSYFITSTPFLLLTICFFLSLSSFFPLLCLFQSDFLYTSYCLINNSVVQHRSCISLWFWSLS